MVGSKCVALSPSLLIMSSLPGSIQHEFWTLTSRRSQEPPPFLALAKRKKKGSVILKNKMSPAPKRPVS